MPTRTQELLWTPLPAGFTDDRGRLRLSAMVSPRLVVSPRPTDVLASFPDMLAWPAIVSAATFEVDFAGTTATADRVSQPDDAISARLFSPSTPVHARAFEDRRDTHVLSYPVAEVENDLAAIYGPLGVEADGELPLLETMRTRFAPLGRGLLALTPDEILAIIREGGEREFPTSPTQRLGLVDLYNTPLAAPEPGRYTKQGPDDPREDVEWESYRLVDLPAPDSFRRSVDFHQIVTALAQYPLLLRLTGLVVDLELDRGAFPAGPVTAPLALRVSWTSLPDTATAGVSVLPDVFSPVLTVLDERHFAATVPDGEDSSQVDGYLRLVERDFDVSQLDVNGSALKVRQFAVNMFQLPPVPPSTDANRKPDPVGVPPERTGTPALRSGGLTVARRRRGADVEARFDRSGQLDDALQTGTPELLVLDDLVRGYHVEVFDDTAGEWRSLCRRDTRFTFVVDHHELENEANEGIVRLGASASADGHNADILKLYEGLFTWSGWSLTAPPVGRAVLPDDSVGDGDGLAPDGLPLDVDHHVRARSLPSLRFGRAYAFRMRAVDLAGNTRPFEPHGDAPPLTETAPVPYLRFEPLEAPTIALVGGAGATEFPGPGEDLATVAIRSLNATPADNTVPTLERAQRHVVPPLGSQRQAELHGMLDTAGRIDPTTYALLTARDGALPEAIHPITGKGFPAAAAGFTLPFLPDPLARDGVLRLYGRIDPHGVETIDVPWYPGGGAWPDARPFRVEIFEGGAGDAPALDEAAGVLRVPLAKAEYVRLRFGHRLTDADLDLLGIWRWVRDRWPADAVAAARLLDLARTGQHWMLTPWRDIELVHAVQKPLVEPAIQQLAISRPTGRTTARLAFRTPIDSRSTEKLDLFGRWLDPVDDPAEPAPRARLGGGQRAAELILRRLEAPGVNPPGVRVWTARAPVPHEFGDTRYRRVGYHLIATTRFTHYLPAPLQDPANAADLTVTSTETIGFVPNSAPPPAPDIVYVIPTFGWTRTGDDDSAWSWRDGGGLRVYLRRPWLVSGYMEMLAVVLPRAGTPSAEPALASFVTQWGADPIWRSGAVQGAAPAPTRFALAVTAGPIPPARLDPMIPDGEGELPASPFSVSGLPLPGAPGQPPVDVAPHLVGWDPDRRLWFADIVVDPGTAYTPFIRFALARYQPISAFGSHLSAVATTEFVQLLPDRLAVLTRVSPLTYHVGLYGHTPERARNVEFAVERLAADADTDLAWEPLPDVVVTTRRASTTGPFPFLRRRPARAARAGSVEPIPLPMSRTRLLTEARELLIARRFEEIVLRPDLIELLRPPQIRQVEVVLPRAPEEGERFRLVVTELELRDADAEHLDPPPAPTRDPRRRIVYVETLDLT